MSNPLQNIEKFASDLNDVLSCQKSLHTSNEILVSENARLRQEVASLRQEAVSLRDRFQQDSKEIHALKMKIGADKRPEGQTADIHIISSDSIDIKDREKIQKFLQSIFQQKP
jgi:hypothetical protein